MASKEPFPRVCFLVGSEEEENAVRALERRANRYPTDSAFFADVVRVADARADFDGQVFQRVWSWRTSVLVTTSSAGRSGADRSAPGACDRGAPTETEERDDATNNSVASSADSPASETDRRSAAGRRPTWLDNELSERVATQLPARLRKKWLHFTLRELRGFLGDAETETETETETDADAGPRRFAHILHACYLSFAADRALSRPRASVFTTAFHSGPRIFRVYDSLLRQTERDWEWVVLDDSREEETTETETEKQKQKEKLPSTFALLQDIARRDVRVRVFRRGANSGSIGRAKSEAAALCEGEVLVEVDHDDRLMPDALEQICAALLARFPSAGFAYMNYAEVHEHSETPFRYPEPFALGYGHYRNVRRADGPFPAYAMANTPDVNDRSVTSIVGVPNHPRAWKRDVLLGTLGNFSPMLPVADDYELLLHTVAKTPAAKIDRLGYVQFRNEGGNNFTFLKNAEITRLQTHLSHLLREKYDMDARFRAAGVHERDRIEHRRINFLTSDALRAAGPGPRKEEQDNAHLFVPWEQVFGPAAGHALRANNHNHEV